MAIKKQKSRKHKKRSIKDTKHVPLQPDNNLPEDHHYGEEMANVISSLLLKAQVNRIEKPTSIEAFLKKELHIIIKQKKLSRVAIMFFESIYDMAKENPLRPMVKDLFEISYSEYMKIHKHMATIEDISFVIRLEKLLKEAGKNNWSLSESIECKNKTTKHLVVTNDWLNYFNEDKQLTKALPVTAISNNISELTEIAYQSGLLLHRKSKKGNMFELEIYPRNNIPGIPMTPPSISCR